MSLATEPCAQTSHNSPGMMLRQITESHLEGVEHARAAVIFLCRYYGIETRRVGDIYFDEAPADQHHKWFVAVPRGSAVDNGTFPPPGRNRIRGASPSRLRKYPTGAASLLTQGLVFR